CGRTSKRCSQRGHRLVGSDTGCRHRAAEMRPVEPDLVRTSEGMSAMSDRLRPSSAFSESEEVAPLLARVRASSPLTHCITNAVVTGFTANVLLAIGAAPAMVDIVDEAGPFAGIASGLLVNLGTPTPEQRAASREAVAAATAAGTPWVLDPVAIGALPVRTALAHELVTGRPTAIRGNASEILALGGMSAGGR